MPISNMDRQLLLRCEDVKKDSHDPHRQVGVLIADKNGQILASGANAPPLRLGLTPSVSHTAISSDPDWKYFFLEHAERNAINSARDQGHSLLGCTLYGTLFPCADCARAIVAAGISRLVLLGPIGNHDRDKKWMDHYHYAQKIFELAAMQVDIVMGKTP